MDSASTTPVAARQPALIAGLEAAVPLWIAELRGPHHHARGHGRPGDRRAYDQSQPTPATSGGHTP